MKYVCDVCGWEYDEEKGYPEGGIAPEAPQPMKEEVLLTSPLCTWYKVGGYSGRF